MTKKQTASLAEQRFNELDNWLGIMDLDPPQSSEEKQAMYQRLMEILETMFDPKEVKVGSSFSSLSTLDRKTLYRDLRKIIQR